MKFLVSVFPIFVLASMSDEAMSDEERFFAASYLGVLIRQDDPEYRRMLGERLDRIAGGKKITLEQAAKADATLETEGL